MNTKKGYFTLEAAVFLPIFIIGVLTLGCFIKAAGAAGNVIHAGTDEAKYLASRAYTVRSPVGFYSRMAERVCDEDRNVDTASVKNMRYMSSSEDEGLISFDIASSVSVRLPAAVKKKIRMSDSFLCRGWIGRSKNGKGMGFDAIEGEDCTVYVFPDHGKRYHGESCTFVAGKPVQMMMNNEIKHKYSACETCHPGSMENGSLVYCYTAYGEAYHRGGCSHVDKYIIPMAKNQAEEQGYTPCSKCGGK